MRTRLTAVALSLPLVACGSRTDPGLLLSSDGSPPADSNAADGAGDIESPDASVDAGPQDTGMDVETMDGSADAIAETQAPPPSCPDGDAATTGCGPTSESCCTSLSVTPDVFYRTYVNDGGGAGDSGADPATISPFRLDKYQVTVGRFRQFVNAVLLPDGGAAWVPAPGSGKHTHLNGGLGLVDVGASMDGGTAYEQGWDPSDDIYVAPDPSFLGADVASTWTDSPGNDENLPMNLANWPQAYAFCIWDGGFLPSEAEWEYVAAGGSEQREYPWGSMDPGASNQYAIYDCQYPDPGAMMCPDDVTNIAPVGTATLGAGRWGQLDLSGQLYDWILDYDANYVDPCVDCANLTGGAYRVIRGGVFNAGAGMPPDRAGFTPATNGNIYIGFRCGRTP